MTTAAIANASPTPNPAAPTPQTAARQKEPGAFARELGRAADDGQSARRAEARQADRSDRAQENKAARKPGTEARRPEDGQAAKDEAETRKSDAEGEDEDTATGDVSALLAGLLNPAARAAAAAARGNAARGGATRSEGEAAGGTAAAGRGHAGAASAKADLATAMKAGAAEAKAAPADTGGERRADFRAELAAFTPQAGQAPAQQAAAPDARAAATATPYAGQIAAPVGSPDFAPGLSAQVSVMLRDGVQEARLQLNPAEMGPITVQIQIEGSNAQVVMAAQQADTRQALEQALPSLASALQESGLTLTGGGVFEQRQGGERDAGGEPGSRATAGVGGTRGGSDDGDAALAAASAPQRRTRGVLDTYA